MVGGSRGPRYRALIAQAIILGLFTGLFGVGYLIAVEVILEGIWGHDATPAGWFSGSIWHIVIPLGFGLLVGAIYKIFRLPSRFPGFIEDLQEGAVDPGTAPGALGIAILTLVSGPSLGPEAPLGTAGGAMGTWLARRRGGDAAHVRALNFIGISGAFGGLLSTPIGGPLLAFELEHEQTHSYYFTNLVPGVVAGAVSFGVMWPIIGAPFEGLLSIPQGNFESWMLLAAAGLGVVGAMLAVVVGKMMIVLVKAMKPLDSRPLVRGAVGGLGIGLISFVLPLTMFSGQSTLPIILDNYETFGIGLLLALAILKAVALAVSLGGGFFGGPIFPMFFIGTVVGLAIHLIFPAIPVAVAVGSLMAALGAAVALLPLSMAVLVAILIDSGLEVFGAVAVAAVTAYAIRVAITPGARGDLQVSVGSAAKGD